MEDYNLVEAAADLGMILGACLGYILQTITMIQTQEAEGFSPLVSFIMLVSSLIRIFWWWSERFSRVILTASVVQVFCQLALLFIWVKVNNKSSKSKDADGKPPAESFWFWRSFSSYLSTVAQITAVLAIATYFFAGEKQFDIILGTLSSGIEVSS